MGVLGGGSASGGDDRCCASAEVARLWRCRDWGVWAGAVGSMAVPARSVVCSTVYDLIARGDLPSVRIGRRIFLTAAMIEVLLGEPPPPPGNLGEAEQPR